MQKKKDRSIIFQYHISNKTPVNKTQCDGITY